MTNDLFPYQHDYFSFTNTHNLESWHWHDTFELLIIKSGIACMKLQQMQIQLKEGDMFFINSNVVHSLEAFLVPCEYEQIHFHPRLLYGETYSILYHKYINTFICCLSFPGILLNDKQKEKIQDVVLLERKQTFGYEFFLREELTHLILDFYQCYDISESEETKIKLKSRKNLKDMIHWIQTHYAGHITVEQLAIKFQLTTRECYRCFEREVGISPIQYLLLYRLIMASHLLKATTLSIAQIANEVGITSPSYFTKQFKRQFKLTPNQYRKRS